MTVDLYIANFFSSRLGSVLCRSKIWYLAVSNLTPTFQKRRVLFQEADLRPWADEENQSLVTLYCILRMSGSEWKRETCLQNAPYGESANRLSTDSGNISDGTKSYGKTSWGVWKEQEWFKSSEKQMLRNLNCNKIYDRILDLIRVWIRVEYLNCLCSLLTIEVLRF